MNLKRWEEKEGFKSRFGCRLQMIGGAWFTGGASGSFKSHTSLLFTVKEACVGQAGQGSGGNWFEMSVKSFFFLKTNKDCSGSCFFFLSDFYCEICLSS